VDGDFRIGPWSVQPRLNTVSRNGTSAHLEPKVMQVLVCLAQHAGEPLPKESLLRAVWSDTFVSDDVLTRSIYELRRVFEDDPREGRVIQTIPKRGYRLVVPVEKPQTRGLAANSVTRFGLTPWRVLAVVLATALVVVTVWRISSRPSESGPFQVEEVPLTGLTGAEVSPAFSPDGNQVAFARYGNMVESSGIYTALIGGERPLQLTANANDCCPTWSPDAQYVAFFRTSETEFAIYTVPALGGTERRLYARRRDNHPLDDALGWSPDGKLLAFSEWIEDRSQITLFSVIDSKTRALSSGTVGAVDRGPAFSPDGKNVAFVRSVGPASGPAGDLFLVSVAGGNPKRLTFDNRFIWGPPAWASDGRGIVFSSDRGGLPNLWRISASGGVLSSVAGVGPVSLHPSIPLHGHRLAYVHSGSNQNIWLLKLLDEKHPRDPATILISSKGTNALPQFSPDGAKIAFESERSGYNEVWVCSNDGSDPKPVTSLAGYSGSPHWSPDGRSLAFDFRAKDHSDIYVVEVPDGLPRLLPTFRGADNVVPSWSRDGQSIYFSSKREGEAFQIWKAPAKGGAPAQVTKKGGYSAVESADGFLYYSQGLDEPAIWKTPVVGGEESLVLDAPGLATYSQWTLARNGIYFIDSKTYSKETIVFFDFATGRIVPVWAMEKPPWAGLAVSPDGRSVIYPQDDQDEYNIIVLKTFF
jgi:Tol biopolymer transport system component/DNA-binding winged helix-turn-helix (wHTH) protein